MLNKLDNPFYNRGAIKNPKYFYGRKIETKVILDFLRVAQSCSIIGERKMGKTSLLLYISNPYVLKQYGINANEYIFLYLDCQALVSITQNEFYALILKNIYDNINNINIKKEINTLTKNKAQIRLMDFESIILDIIKNIKIVFLFDEFESITKNKNFDDAFLWGLRSLSKYVAYVTATQRSLIDLSKGEEVQPSVPSPFFNVFQPIDLGPFKDDEARELIEGYLKWVKSLDYFSFSSEDFKFISNISGLHPFFLQIACYHAFKFKIDRKKALTDLDHESIKKNCKREFRDHFVYMWEHLTDNEKKVIRKIISGNMEVSDSNVENLVRRGIIKKHSDGYAVFSVLFEEFVAQLEQHDGNGPFDGISFFYEILKGIILLIIGLSLLAAIYILGPDLFKTIIGIIASILAIIAYCVLLYAHRDVFFDLLNRLFSRLFHKRT